MAAAFSSSEGPGRRPKFILMTYNIHAKIQQRRIAKNSTNRTRQHIHTHTLLHTTNRWSNSSEAHSGLLQMQVCTSYRLMCRQCAQQDILLQCIRSSLLSPPPEPSGAGALHQPAALITHTHTCTHTELHKVLSSMLSVDRT